MRNIRTKAVQIITNSSNISPISRKVKKPNRRQWLPVREFAAELCAQISAKGGAR